MTFADTTMAARCMCKFVKKTLKKIVLQGVKNQLRQLFFDCSSCSKKNKQTGGKLFFVKFV